LTLAIVVVGDTGYDDDDTDDDDVVREPPLEKFVAGSTDDLGRLFDLEKRLFKTLDEFMIKNGKTKLKDEVERIQTFLLKYQIDGSLLQSQVLYLSGTYKKYRRPVYFFRLTACCTILNTI